MKVIFVVQGYEKKTEEGNLEDSVIYEVYAKSGEDAIKKAEKYVKKSFYRVSSVIEK